MKNLLKVIVIILMLIGIFYGVNITIERNGHVLNDKEVSKKIFEMPNGRVADITAFYTYGRAFNIKGKINNVSKDNFESVKMIITDGRDYEKEYKLNYAFEEKNLIFHSDHEINSGIILDDLENKDYYVFVRIKVNNNVEPKYYSLKNISEYGDLDYYTITKEGQNRKAEIRFTEQTRGDDTLPILSISLSDSELPEDVYDVVIDAGHGGKDEGNRSGSDTEADIALEYAKILKDRLEEGGLKVKLTRDDDNSELYNYTNMYDSGGRITVACKSRAKYMISFHVNNGVNTLKGLEIYAPCKCNLNFSKKMADKIVEYTNIEYSNNSSFKEQDGVYVQNYTNSVIKAQANTAEKKGYEPYPITTDTPYHYTIREVGGIATNAYVDGRNKDYSKNEYYNSNQGLECYQIELGYIKNDLDIIKNEKEGYIRGIAETILELVK